MRQQKFYIALLSINVGLGLGLWWFHSRPPYDQYLDLSLIGLAILNVFNLLIYYRARYLSKHSYDKKYMHLIFKNFLIKLIIVIGPPVLYYLKKQPEDSFFVIPFVVIYLVFTIFETWYLNQSAVMRGEK